ncbi:MAG TPA: protein kinase [Gemmatimonadales bacterium]|jgi:serine/threonine-protein kinase|nr:protein kinase [Gemmatimonadales bacterium]
MTCFKCGATVAEDQKFCGRCGALVSDPEAHTVIVEGPEGGLLERVRTVLGGDFEVTDELARGGMGVVFRARELELGRPVAIKVLAAELGITPRAAERFKREARMVAELEHPNIVPVYRVGQIADILFIAMKFIEGRSLGRILDTHGALPVPVVLHVLRSVLRPLAYAHDRGIVHRDVKGDNILIDDGGRVLVSDFGVALRSADVNLTVDGTVIGTPAFMSPEQCRGKRAGPQSDQYSVGIVAFQMLTGRVPFESETLAGFIQHHLFTPHPDLRAARDDVPPGLLGTINRALAKDPDARFASTRDMLEAVEGMTFSETDRRESEDVLRGLASGAEVAKVATRDIRSFSHARTAALVPARASRRTIGLVAAGVVVVAGTAVLALPRRGATPPATVADTARPVAAAPDTSAAARTTRPPPAPRVATGTLRILTTPPDAVILIDGQRVGVGAVIDHAIPVGRRRIEARLRGYASYDTIVDVAAGALVNLRRVTLRAAGATP